jgi:adenylylsulfate kinase/chloramphenicol 3-O phosphotransferase
MEHGKILYLNGVTSTGKSSIVNALRSSGKLDFYYLSDDIFEDNIIDVEYDAPNYWSELADAVFLMYRTAKLFSDHGKTVVIDSMLMENKEFSPHYSRMLDIFRDNPLYVIDVSCPLEICRQRNLQRLDRHEFQSHEQAAVMAKDVAYALHLDTSVLTPEQCAQQILTTFFR